MNEIEEWEVEKILNKRKIRGVVKYLVYLQQKVIYKRKRNIQKMQRKQQQNLRKDLVQK